MKQNISNQRSRAGRMKNFFAAKNSFIEPNTDIINEIEAFNVLLGQFDEFAGRQQQPITAYTEAKKQAWEMAVLITGKWGVRCHQKAGQRGMPELGELLNHNQAEIMRLDDEAGLNFMKDMREGLNDNLALLAEQGLTDGIVSEIYY